MEADAVPETPERLRLWADRISSSPLYRSLAHEIADDPEVFDLVAAMPHTPRPLLFMAAVHDALLAGTAHQLVHWYASLTSSPRAPATAYPAFRDFALTHREQIETTGRRRYVQTNEVRRCAILLPALSRAAAELGRFHLVDVGTSAGLNLSFDRYAYVYGPGTDGTPVATWGPPRGRPLLVCESRGTPPRLARHLEMGRRLGVDLHPIDPADPSDRRWLEALIWPEHHERRIRLEEALDAAGPVERIAGDALETLPELIRSLPSKDPVVVMHSFALNQFTEEMRSRLDDLLDTERTRRPLVRIGLEHWSFDEQDARIRYESDGWVDLGTAQHHGEWIHLVDDPRDANANPGL